METWEFGHALRRWRDRVTPETVGLPLGGRRRAVGLRREELAALTGISADYLTRLEQGRATSPSEQVVESLARALRLTGADLELIFRLSGHPVPSPDIVPTRITPSIQRLLDRFSHTPVAVYDATMTLLTANPPYDALMGDSTKLRGKERNALWRNLVGAGNRAVMTAEEQAEFEARLVSDLRLTTSKYPADRSVRRLVNELSAQSPRFDHLWKSGYTGSGSQTARTKTIDHPAVGRITLDCDTLIVAADDLRIMVYTAEPGSHDAELLNLAIVIGIQNLTEQQAQ